MSSHSQTINQNTCSQDHNNDTQNTQETNNLATNHHIGVPIDENKPDNTYRIYCGNPNGIKLHAKGGDFGEYMEEMKRLQVDTTCLFEINLDTTKSSTKRKLYETSKSLFDHNTTTFASSPIPALNEFKPGGTLILTQGHAHGRVIDKGTDPMGRWSYHTLACRNNRNLTVVAAYQVCDQTVTEGDRIQSLTATAQQDSLLRQQHRPMTPRQAFVYDLRKFIRTQHTQGNGILLTGDFNEPLDERYNGMTKLCSDFNLVDLLYHFTNEDAFPTYYRGQKRVDYILCDHWVAMAAIQGCYEPFQYRTKGDHRNMIVDFDTDFLFGNPTHKLATPAQREFSSKDLKSNRKYIEAKHKYLLAHDFDTRLNNLSEVWDPGIAESLDKDFQRAGHHAAKACKRKPNIVYVKKLAALRMKKNVLLRVISQSRQTRSLSDSIAFQAREGNTFLLPSSLEECKEQCVQTQREIREMEQHAATHRRNEQKKLEEEATIKGDKKKATAIRNKRVAENTKNMFKKLRSIRGTVKSGLTRLQVPRDAQDRQYKQCRDWISVEAPKEIEEKLRDRNQFHFGQAKGSFPTIPPFSEWVDWGASSHVSELLLEGEFSDDTLNDLTKDLLRHMKKKTTLDEIPDIITSEEWTQKITVWPENTSTSPSGFHLTHSKALIAEHDLAIDSPDRPAFEHKRTQLIQWQVAILNIAIKHQHVYERWKTIVNVMILKEPGNVKIHRLRVIHLYEHDYNLLLALKWRTMIQNGTRQQLINPGQYGAVPGRDAIAPTILEELQYEICRASKRPLIHLDYDATACYDRIIMSLGSLISRGFGQHRSIVYINATTLSEAKYILKTQLGVSETFYKHCELFPIYGSGQGAGNSPGLWCAISSVLFDIYEEKANGAYFQSPDGSIHVRIYMIGFVDDTSGSTNDFLLPTQAPLSHYSALATSDAQRWNDLLQLSGGALEDSKCSYHFMSYQFTISGLAILKGGKFDPQISIKFNEDTSVTALKQLSAFQSHKTLGTQKAPAGTTTSSFAVISKKNQTHTLTVARSPLDRIDTWTYYHAIYLPSITYPFPSCTLTDSQCCSLQKQIKQAVLPKYGFNRNTPNAVVYGHTDFAGIDMRSLPVEKGLSQLLALITSLRSDGVAQKLALIAISWMQLLAGTSFPVFTDVHTPLPHLDPMKWLPAIRNFLATLDASLDISKDFVPPLQRENDVFLIDVVIALSLKNTAYKLFNACRLFLGVTLLSDITNAAGTDIRAEILSGRPSVLDTHKGLMPYQDNPNTKAWGIWRHVLHSLTKARTTHLNTTLGRWFITGPATHRKWRTYLKQDTNTIYLRKDNHYEHLIPTSNGFEYQGMTSESLPHNSIPVDLDYTTATMTLAPHSQIYPSLTKTPPTSFLAYIDTLDTWEKEIIENIQFATDIYDAVEKLSLETPINVTLATSDGSAANFLGTFGWVCSLSNGDRLFVNNGPAYGYRTSSYRSEAYGVLSYHRTILRIFEYTGYPLPKHLELYTDSKSVLDKLSEMEKWPYYYPNATLSADWDVLQSIIATRKQFETPPNLQHVTGHQDDSATYQTLPLPAQLNVDADKLAGTYEYPPHQSSLKVPLIQGNTVQIQTQEGTITANIRKAIRKMASHSKMRRHICKRNKWTYTQFGYVDWVSHGISVRKAYHRKHFTTKFLHNWLPLGNLISKYKPKYDDKCPSCGISPEDRQHFLRCPNRLQWQTQMIAALHQFTDTNFTRPALKDILLESIRSWLNDSEISFPSGSEIYTTLIAKQSSVGWDQLFLGRFVQEWRELQEDYLKTQPGRKKTHTGISWVTGVTKVMWYYTYDNWTARNDAQHGIDAATRETSLLTHAKRDVEALYAFKEEVLPRDKDLFYANATAHFEKVPKSQGLRQWVNTWHPVILSSIKESTRLGVRGLRSIATYFTTAPTTTPPHFEI